MSKTVFFRCDGNTNIGLGHITRCLALADMLKDDFECIFLVQNPSEAIEKNITQSFQLIQLKEQLDFLQEAEYINNMILIAECIVVLDGYSFKTDYQKIIKSSGCKLVCIDDLHAWHFVADVVINHAGGVKREAYSCEEYTKLCLGTKYALLRKPFLEAAQKARKIETINNVFICFGGADIYNLTQKITETCIGSGKFKEIHVVVGSAYTNTMNLVNYVSDKPNIFIYQNVNANEMCTLMNKCELAIVPASSIAYEVSAVGMYMITGWYAENQKGLYRFLSEKYLAESVDNFYNIENNIKYFKTNPRALRQQKMYFDDKLKSRLKGVFYRLSITHKKAQIEDMKLYFDWANDKDVRSNAIETNKISWETHQKWFNKKIDDYNTILYIFNCGKKPIGQVRFDFDSNIGTIDYSLDKKYRGFGLGRVILELAILDVKSKSNIVFKALVKKTNQASIKIFEALNFSLEEENNNILSFYKK